MSATFSRHRQNLPKISGEKNEYGVKIAERLLPLLKKWQSFTQRISMMRPLLHVDTITDHDPSFGQMLDHMAQTHDSFQKAAEMFWRVQANNVELRAVNNILVKENERLRTLKI